MSTNIFWNVRLISTITATVIAVILFSFTESVALVICVGFANGFVAVLIANWLESRHR